MSTTTKKKKAMIVIAVALVAALAVTGTLMASFFKADTPLDWEDYQAGDLEVNLYEYRDIDGDGTIGQKTIAGETLEAPEEYYAPVNYTNYPVTDISAGGTFEKQMSIGLADDGVDAYARIKTEAVIYFGVPYGSNEGYPSSFNVTSSSIYNGWDENSAEKKAYDAAAKEYYSKFAAVLFTLRDGIKAYSYQAEDEYYSGEPNGGWFEFDPTAAEEEMLNGILDGEISPHRVTVTGYFYHGNPDGTDGKELSVIEGTGMAKTPKVLFHEFITKAYQIKNNFMTNWNSILSDEYKDFDALMASDTDATDHILASTYFDTVTPTNNEVYVSANDFPLTGKAFFLNYTGQAVEAKEENSDKAYDEVFNAAFNN
jgi:hypothetical protein